jgi:hypothetical protein
VAGCVLESTPVSSSEGCTRIIWLDVLLVAIDGRWVQVAVRWRKEA